MCQERNTGGSDRDNLFWRNVNVGDPLLWHNDIVVIVTGDHFGIENFFDNLFLPVKFHFDGIGGVHIRFCDIKPSFIIGSQINGLVRNIDVRLAFFVFFFEDFAVWGLNETETIDFRVAR